MCRARTRLPHEMPPHAAQQALLARTRDDLERAIAAGLERITSEDAKGWFYGCGYSARRQSLCIPL